MCDGKKISKEHTNENNGYHLGNIEPKEAESASRLCAAAPDLLAALELALEEIHQGMDYDGPNAYPSTKRTVDVARAAIRKAKGE